MKIPKLPTNLSPEEKLAALGAASQSNDQVLAEKDTGGKPWRLADKKSKAAYPARIDGDINAKLEFVLQKMGRGVSKNNVINQSIDEFCNKWLTERGFDI